MGKTSQNMPQNSEILYYHPFRMWLIGATRFKQGLSNDGYLKFSDFHTRKMVKASQNMPQEFRDSILSKT